MPSTQNIWILISSYLYVTLIAHIVIYPIISLMWAILQKETDNVKLRPRKWQSRIIGILDRVLFLVSLQMGKPEFVGLWLGLKTVSQYKRWSEDEPGRATFNIFLTGNGLSILFAIAGAGIIKYGKHLSFQEDIFFFFTENILFLFVILGPIVLSIAIYLLLRSDYVNAEIEEEKKPEDIKRKK